MRLVRARFGRFAIFLPALTLTLVPARASAKPKTPSSGRRAHPPAAESVELDEDAQLAPKARQAADTPQDLEPRTEARETEPAPSELDGAGDRRAANAEAARDAGVSPHVPSPFDFEAGLRAVNRHFTYKDTPAELFPNKGYPTLVPFELRLGPALFFDGNLYPLAFASPGAWAHIGFSFGYELNFATNAIFAQGSPIERTLHTRASQFYVGARARIPIGVHELGLLAAYGQQKFELTGDENAPLAPDVHYKFVRLSGDAKLAFGDVSLGAHVGTRLVSDTGGLRRDWFPNTKTKSLEAGVFLGYRLSRAFELVGAADLVRYVFDFNPIPPQTDPWSKPVAGGATDQYLTASLALRYHVPAR